MAKANWKDIAELIGIAAIVASLIFVGLQMRQTHEIALVTLYQMRADAAREVMSVGLQNEAMLNAYSKADAGEVLDETDENLLAADAFIFFNHFENSHFLYQQGFLTEEQHRSDLASIVDFLDDPFAIKYWAELKGLFRDSFVADVDRAVAALPAMASSPEELRGQVLAVEAAFAQTMADRDLEAFTSFLADDALFYAGDEPLHGKQAVIDAWSRYYEGPDAPFSWDPENVELLDGGELAYSSGPVRDAEGNDAGRFNSIWRHDGAGNWRVIFDKGSE